MNPKSNDDHEGDHNIRNIQAVVNYGYHYGAPDTTMEHPKFDCGETKRKSQPMEDVDYGYGDCAPDIASSFRVNPVTNCISNGYFDGVDRALQRIPRRSSMKQEGACRRSSIGVSGERTVQLPGRKRPVKHRTSITFQENKNEVKEVEPFKNEQLWFKKDEITMIRQKAKMVAEISTSRNHNDEAMKDECVRGLEKLTNSATVYKEQNVAWRSVFQEQYRQNNTGTFDDEVVSTIYRIATYDSAQRALERARQDSREARQYTRSTRSNKVTRRCSIA